MPRPSDLKLPAQSKGCSAIDVALDLGVVQVAETHHAWCRARRDRARRSASAHTRGVETHVAAGHRRQLRDGRRRACRACRAAGRRVRRPGPSRSTQASACCVGDRGAPWHRASRARQRRGRFAAARRLVDFGAHDIERQAAGAPAIRAGRARSRPGSAVIWPRSVPAARGRARSGPVAGRSGTRAASIELAHRRASSLERGRRAPCCCSHSRWRSISLQGVADRVLSSLPATASISARAVRSALLERIGGVEHLAERRAGGRPAAPAQEQCGGRGEGRDRQQDQGQWSRAAAVENRTGSLPRLPAAGQIQLDRRGAARVCRRSGGLTASGRDP